jgi:hypothetical protein
MTPTANRENLGVSFLLVLVVQRIHAIVHYGAAWTVHIRTSHGSGFAQRTTPVGQPAGVVQAAKSLLPIISCAITCLCA